MLTSRKSTDVNIVNIEDPIEYQVPGASQVQVDTKGGLTLRQLPPRRIPGQDRTSSWSARSA